MRHAVTALLILLVGGSVLWAGTGRPNEIFGGVAADADSGDGMAGFSVGYAHYFTGNFGLVSDFRGHFQDSREYYQWLAGPRYTFNRGGWVSPFVHGLAGIGHHNFPEWVQPWGGAGNTMFVAGGGVGLDVRLSRNTSLRPLQLDFLRQMGDVDRTHIGYTFALTFRF